MAGGYKSYPETGGGGGGGGVSSVGLALPSSTFAVTGSPVTTTGTLTGSFKTQTANTVLAGPTSGGVVVPAFRALVGADLPNPSSSTLGGVQSKAAVTHQFLTSISTSGVPALAQPAFSDLSGSATGAQLPLPAVATLGGVFSKAVVSHQFLTSISSVDGSIGQAQPAFTDISGSVAAAQMPALTGDVTTSAGAVATTVAKIAGVTVSGTTGTTNVVFSTSPTFSTSVLFGNYHMEPSEHDAGNSSTAVTIDLSTGSVQKLTLTGNTTITLTNPVTGGTYVFRILTGAGSFAVTWPGTVKWPSGTAPVITTAASKMDLISLLWDGTDYYGTFQQAYTP